MKNEFKVSQLFVDIFHYFNVYDQRDRMKNLSRIELYLLLDTCIEIIKEERDKESKVNIDSDCVWVVSTTPSRNR